MGCWTRDASCFTAAANGDVPFHSARGLAGDGEGAEWGRDQAGIKAWKGAAAAAVES